MSVNFKGDRTARAPIGLVFLTFYCCVCVCVCPKWHSFRYQPPAAARDLISSHGEGVVSTPSFIKRQTSPLVPLKRLLR